MSVFLSSRTTQPAPVMNFELPKDSMDQDISTMHSLDLDSPLIQNSFMVQNIELDLGSPTLNNNTPAIRTAGSWRLWKRRFERLAAIRNQLDIIQDVIKENQLEKLNEGLKLETWDRRELVEGLFAATTHHKWECLAALIDSGVPLTRLNRKHQTVLHKLVLHCSSYPEETLNMVCKILHIVSQNDGEDVDFFVNKVCSTSGFTALYQAVVARHAECVKVLLNYGAKPNIGSEFYMRSPLMEAVWNGQRECIRALLGAGANVCLADFRARSVLTYVVRSEKFDLLKFIINEVPAASYDLAISKAAVKLDDVDMLRDLIKCGMPLATGGSSPDSVLHTAAGRDSLNCLKVLLKRKDELKLDVNLIDKLHGMSPLQRACCHGQLEAIILLLSNGADTDIYANDAHTPLFYSLDFHDTYNTKVVGLEVMKYILRYGCTVDLECLDDMTHLTFALKFCHLFAARLLVAAGARNYGFSAGHHRNWVTSGLSSRKEINDFILIELQEPQSLYHICRTAVRNSLRRDIENKIRKMPLPKHIKEYLNLSECEDIIEEYTNKVELMDGNVNSDDNWDSTTNGESDLDPEFSSEEESDSSNEIIGGFEDESL